jgi:hypothetical protein
MGLVGDAADGGSSGWSGVLIFLGWLCIVATVGTVGFGLIWFLTSLWFLVSSDLVGLTAIFVEAITIASFGIALGVALLMTAQASRPNTKKGHFKLWAKLLLLAAFELSLGFPLFCYSTILYLRILGQGYADPLAADLLGATALASSTPFLIGIVVLAAALIWGRRKPEPDIPAVFS